MPRITPNDPIYQYLLILTAIILIFKASLAVFLARKIYKRTKKEGEFKLDFLFAVFILTVCLFISRLFLLYFDFYLTYFDQTEYWKPESVFVWKVGQSIISIGLIVLYFVVDKEALKFKLKGIPVIFSLLLLIIFIVYPVNSIEDFKFLTFLFTVANLMILFIAFFFLYIGITSKDLRKTGLSIFFGIVIYVISAMIAHIEVIEAITGSYGNSGLRTAYLLWALGKIIGLALLAYATPKMYKTPA